MGVKLEPIYVESASEVQQLIASQRVHLGLGMLPVTKASNEFTFGPSIKITNVIVVTHTDAEKIVSTKDLAGLSVAVSDPAIAMRSFAENPTTHFL